MGILRTCFRLLIIVSGVSLLVSIPFLIDHYGRSKLLNILKEELPAHGLQFEELHANNVTYAFPIGLSFKGLSAVLDHQEQDLNPVKISLSADSVSIRLLISNLILQGKIPLQVDIRGLIVQDTISELEGKSQSDTGVLSTLDYQRLVLENVSLVQSCDTATIFNLSNARMPLYNCILQNWRSKLKLERVFFEVLQDSNKFIIPVKEVEDYRFVIGALELSELSNSFRSQLTPTETSVIQTSPIYGLILLKIRRYAEEKALALFEDDNKYIEKYYTAFYHYLISNYIGASASKAIQHSDQTSGAKYMSDEIKREELQREALNFLVLLGRVSSERGVPLEQFEDKQFFIDLMRDSP